MHKNLSQLPITIRLLLHHQIIIPISRKSPLNVKSKSKPAQSCVSILRQKKMLASSSFNVTTPQLPFSDLTTPVSGSSSSSSSNLATAAAAVEELVVNHPLQDVATIEQSPTDPGSPRYADVCSFLSIDQPSFHPLSPSAPPISFFLSF